MNSFDNKIMKNFRKNNKFTFFRDALKEQLRIFTAEKTNRNYQK